MKWIKEKVVKMDIKNFSHFIDDNPKVIILGIIYAHVYDYKIEEQKKRILKWFCPWILQNCLNSLNIGILTSQLNLENIRHCSIVHCRISWTFLAILHLVIQSHFHFCN